MKPLSHRLFKKIDGIELQLHVVLMKGEIHIGLVRLERDKKPHVLFTEYSRFFADLGTYKNKTIQELGSMLGRATTQLGVMYEQSDLYNSHQSIHQIIVSVAPEFCTVEQNPVVLAFESPQKITIETLAYHADETLDNQQLIARHISNMALNGYDVEESSALGLEASNLNFTEEIHLIDTSLIAKIQQTLNRHMPGHEESILFVSHLDSQVRALADHEKTGDAFTMFSFGLEDSYIYIFGKERVFKQISYGQHEFFTQLQREEIGYDLNSTISELKLFNKKDLLDARMQTISYISDIEADVVRTIFEEETHGTTVKPLFTSTRSENAYLINAIFSKEQYYDINKEFYGKEVTAINPAQPSRALIESLLGEQSRALGTFS